MLWKVRDKFESSIRVALRAMGHYAGTEIEPTPSTRLLDHTLLEPGVVCAAVPGGTHVLPLPLLTFTCVGQRLIIFAVLCCLRCSQPVEMTPFSRLCAAKTRPNVWNSAGTLGLPPTRPPPPLLLLLLLLLLPTASLPPQKTSKKCVCCPRSRAQRVVASPSSPKPCRCKSVARSIWTSLWLRL